MSWMTFLALILSVGMSAAALDWSVRRGTDIDTSSPAWKPSSSRAQGKTGRDATTAVDLDLSRVLGHVEPLPQNVFHVVPYNDWPLFEISVLEGQRLKFTRANGRWQGDRSGLTIQFETPAEIDSKKEDVEIARLEKQSSELGAGVLEEELKKESKAADVRERNARQEFERLEQLHTRTAASEQEFQRARNILDLARVQRDQLRAVKDKKLAQAQVQTELAEHRLRRAQSEFELANFKREMSWSNVPRRAGQFEEVVVTKVSAAIGDVPSGTGERKAWVEVIDDRVLQVRVFLTISQIARIRVGQPVPARQDGRIYYGEIGAINIVADEKTHRVPVLVRVGNHDRCLRINTPVEVDLAR